MHRSATRSRLTLVLAIFAVAWLGVAGYKFLNSNITEPVISTNVHIPVANPPLEPDRPDLLEEPRIEDVEIQE